MLNSVLMILVFVVLGPPVGTAVEVLLFAIEGPVDVLGMIFSGIAYYIGYYFGWAPALVTAFVSMIVSRRIVSAAKLYWLTAICGAVASGGTMLVFFNDGHASELVGFAARTALAGLVAALVCTRVTRRFWRPAMAPNGD